MNRVVTITGTKDEVEEAKKWIENIIESVSKSVSNFLNLKRIYICNFNNKFLKKKKLLSTSIG